MELNLRTVLVILGSLVMLGILIDGFRRMRRARQDALKMDVQGNFQFPDEGFSSELPNGGARVIEESTQSELLEEAYAFKDQLDDLPNLSALDEVDIKIDEQTESVYAGEPDFQADSYEPTDVQADEKIDEQTDVQEALDNGFSETIDDDNNSLEDFDISSKTNPEKVVPLNLDEQVPLLMDVEELGVELEPQAVTYSNEAVDVSADKTTTDAFAEENAGEQTEETVKESVEQATAKDSGSTDSSDIGIIDEKPSVEQVSEEPDSNPQEQYQVNQDIVPDSNELDKTIGQIEQEANSSQYDEAPAAVGHEYVENMTTQGAYAPVKKPGPGAEILADRDAPDLVLITHVVPHNEEGFCGEDILYLVNNCDLRHGEKGIFHRFEQPNGEGRIQFSMANSFNPGIFDPETLLHERIYGLSLFMSLPGPEKAMDAFEAMSEMASVIARNLGGDVHDETHSIMALQTIEHNRQQVRDFVRKQKIAAKK